ncbi:MAG: hypothetical protein Fues2KO_51870 [Fuerstiella sp.]
MDPIAERRLGESYRIGYLEAVADCGDHRSNAIASATSDFDHQNRIRVRASRLLTIEPGWFAVMDLMKSDDRIVIASIVDAEFSVREIEREFVCSGLCQRSTELACDLKMRVVRHPERLRIYGSFVLEDVEDVYMIQR